MRHRLLLALFMLLAITAPAAWAAQPLTVLADERRPYAWLENGVMQGICYEMVAATMKELQQVVPIEITSFNRGLHLAMNGHNTAFFSVTPTPERSQALKWVGPLVSSDVYIYRLKGAGPEVRTVEDLNKLEGIGVPFGMQQDLFLRRQGYRVIQFDNIAKMLLGLKNGRVQVVAVGPLALAGGAREAGLDPNRFEQTPILLYRNPLYIAFSKDVSDQTIQRWQKALDKIKREQYPHLREKYLK